MGKNLKGKELGKGLSQRKDGRYSARFVGKNGKRKKKYFPSLQEAKEYLKEPLIRDAHPELFRQIKVSGTTMDDYFEHWENDIVGDSVKFNTKCNHKERYVQNIKPIIGSKRLVDVTPVDCERVFKVMINQKKPDSTPKYKASTIHQVYIVLGQLFRAAFKERLRNEHSFDYAMIKLPIITKKEAFHLSIEDRKRFLAVASGSSNEKTVLLFA